MTLQVSIIVPTYYRVSELEDLFESLLKQTIKPLEVIVVDDTPSNVIEQLCAKWTRKFAMVNVWTIYIRNPRKRSTTSARNVGAEIARGDIVAFFDSDVSLYPRYLEKILEVFGKNSRALGVQGWVVNYYTKKWRVQRLFYAKVFRTFRPSRNSCRFGEHPTVLDRVVTCEALLGANMAYRRRVFDMGFRFDENLLGYAYMEDALFSHTLCRNHPGTLFITPWAKCIHRESEKGCERDLQHLNACRKYVLGRLFGGRGMILYCWQTIGGYAVSLRQLLRRLSR